MGTLTMKLLGELRDNNQYDPVGRLVEVTTLIDEVRTVLLPELAVIRREAADEARQHLIVSGLKATEATRTLAERVNASPQTINRLVQENRAYGKEVTSAGTQSAPAEGEGD